MDEIVRCEACNKKFPQSKQYAHYSGYYCSRKCYDTLFLNCVDCGELNMGAKSNLKEHNEQRCDACYNKAHGLTVVTIGFCQYSRTR